MASNKEINIPIKVDITTLDQDIQKIRTDLQEVGDVSFDNVKTLEQQLSEANDEAQKMAVIFGTNSKEFDNATKKVGQLTAEVTNYQKKIESITPGRGLEKISQVASAGVSGIMALQGAMQMFGVENENVTQSIAKLQGLMAFNDGIKQILDTAKAMGFLSTSSSALSGTMAATGVATTGASVAMRAFRVALVSTGVGALIVLLGTLIGWLTNGEKKTNEFNNVLAKLKGWFEQVMGAIRPVIDAYMRLYSAIASAVIPILQKLMEWLKPVIEFVGYHLVNAIRLAGATIATLVDELGSLVGMLKTLAGDLMSVFKAIGNLSWDKILSLDFSDIENAVKTLGNNMVGYFSGVPKRMANNFVKNYKEASKPMVSTVKKTTKDLVVASGPSVTQIDDTKQKWEELGKQIQDAIKQYRKSLLDKKEEIGDPLSSFGFDNRSDYKKETDEIIGNYRVLLKDLNQINEDIKVYNEQAKKYGKPELPEITREDLDKMMDSEIFKAGGKYINELTDFYYRLGADMGVIFQDTETSENISKSLDILEDDTTMLEDGMQDYIYNNREFLLESSDKIKEIGKHIKNLEDATIVNQKYLADAIVGNEELAKQIKDNLYADNQEGLDQLTKDNPQAQLILKLMEADDENQIMMEKMMVARKGMIVDMYELIKTQVELNNLRQGILDEENRIADSDINTNPFGKQKSIGDRELDATNKRDNNLTLMQAEMEAELDLVGNNLAKREEIEAKYRDMAIKEEIAYKSTMEELNKLRAESYLDTANSIGDALMSIGDAMEEGSAGQKALQIAGTIINTLAGATGAYMQASSTMPPPFGQIVGAASAASVLATGYTNIKAMQKVKVPGNKSEGNINFTPPNISNPIDINQIQDVRAVDRDTMNASLYITDAELNDNKNRADFNNSMSGF